MIESPNSPVSAVPADDFAVHERDFRLFVKVIAIFAAHVLAILALMAIVLL